MSGLKLVLFDIDGTLVDSQSFLTETMLRCIEAVGAPPPPPEKAAQFHFMSLKGYFQSLEGHLTPEQIVAASELMMKTITTARAEGVAPEHLFPGLADVLTQLEADGYLLGIVTNKTARGTELVLKLNGIYERFVTLNHTDNATPKPAPDMVLNALRQTGVEAANALMIGDSVLDMLAAQNAGVRAIAVTWAGREAEPLVEAGAVAVLDRVEQLLPKIRELL